MNLQDTITLNIKQMKKGLYFIFVMLIASCQQKPEETGCNDIIETSYKGEAAIFFHRPVSGSTYQIFLFPLCNAGSDKSKLKEPPDWSSLGKGISFDLTSDNPQFRILYNNAKKANLKGRDQLAANFSSIYYFFANVDVVCNQDGAKGVEESKKLIFESDSVTLKYHFLSYVNFKLSTH